LTTAPFAAHDIEATSDLNNAFRGTNWALLVGSVPRKPVWSAATS